MGFGLAQVASAAASSRPFWELAAVRSHVYFECSELELQTDLLARWLGKESTR